MKKGRTLIIAILLICLLSYANAGSMNDTVAARMDKRVWMIVSECNQQRVGYMYPVGICIQETNCDPDAVCYAFWLHSVKVWKKGKLVTVWRYGTKDAYVGAFQLSLGKVPGSELRRKIQEASYECRRMKAFGTKAQFEKAFAAWKAIDPRFDFAWSARVAVRYFASLTRQYGREDLAAMAYHGGPKTIIRAVQAEARSQGDPVPVGSKAVAKYIESHKVSYYSILESESGGDQYWRRTRERHRSYANSARRNYLAYCQHRRDVGLAAIRPRAAHSNIAKRQEERAVVKRPVKKPVVKPSIMAVAYAADKKDIEMQPGAPRQKEGVQMFDSLLSGLNWLLGALLSAPGWIIGITQESFSGQAVGANIAKFFEGIKLILSGGWWILIHFIVLAILAEGILRLWRWIGLPVWRMIYAKWTVLRWIVGIFVTVFGGFAWMFGRRGNGSSIIPDLAEE